MEIECEKKIYYIHQTDAVTALKLCQDWSGYTRFWFYLCAHCTLYSLSLIVRWDYSCSNMIEEKSDTVPTG